MRTRETPFIARTIDDIRNYDNMRQTVETTTERIAALYDKITSPRSSVPDGMPHVHNPRVGEDMIVAGLDRIRRLETEKLDAELFLTLFEPDWNALTEDERVLLTTYKYSDRYDGEMEAYADENKLSLRQAHRNRRKALEKLCALLYGRET